MDKLNIVKKIIGNLEQPCCAEGYAFAPTNIAICKYWGKRDEELNLPVTSSLSLTLKGSGAFTRIKHTTRQDRYYVNGEKIASDSKFAIRLKNFLDLFRGDSKIFYELETELNIPVASGLASSACGFAALVQALNNFYGWELSTENLSILARLGSGSACRSLWSGFVEWQRGEDPNGMDSLGKKLPYSWPDLRVGILILSSQEKLLSSREAMKNSMLTSPLYADWPEVVAEDLRNLKSAIAIQDFELFGKTMEANALSMHEIMLSSNPPINYSLPETYDSIHKIYEIRDIGIPVFFTQDAGPNLVLFFLSQDSQAVADFFPRIMTVAPFDNNSEQVILVDENDIALGVADKMEAHFSGKLHRGFSIFILRKKAGITEVLLQQRQKDKYHSGELWSNTCCGHPRMGEDVVSAARRRLEEEMGFVTDLKPIGRFRYEVMVGDDIKEHEIDHVFVGFKDIEKPNFNLDEVQDSKWIRLDDLLKDLKLHKEKYTPWLAQAMELLIRAIS